MVRVDLRLFGGVEVNVDGAVVPIGPPQRRHVLAALAVDAGRAVPVETLVARVWDDDPPDGARRALHAHIARIRYAMRQAPDAATQPVRLLRREGGYLLDIDRDRVDLHRFRRLAEQAHDVGFSEAERIVTLRAALGLWRGTPLLGVSGSWAARVRESWRWYRLDVAVAWARAELRSRPDAPIIAQLHDLVGEYPLVEPLAVELMRALYGAGRGAEAVSCYAITRRHLGQELGAEPGPELRELHREILRGHARG